MAQYKAPVVNVPRIIRLKQIPIRIRRKQGRFAIVDESVLRKIWVERRIAALQRVALIYQNAIFVMDVARWP